VRSCVLVNSQQFKELRK